MIVWVRELCDVTLVCTCTDGQGLTVAKKREHRAHVGDRSERVIFLVVDVLDIRPRVDG